MNAMLQVKNTQIDFEDLVEKKKGSYLILINTFYI